MLQFTGLRDTSCFTTSTTEEKTVLTSKESHNNCLPAPHRRDSHNASSEHLRCLPCCHSSATRCMRSAVLLYFRAAILTALCTSSILITGSFKSKTIFFLSELPINSFVLTPAWHLTKAAFILQPRLSYCESPVQQHHNGPKHHPVFSHAEHLWPQFEATNLSGNKIWLLNHRTTRLLSFLLISQKTGLEAGFLREITVYATDGRICHFASICSYSAPGRRQLNNRLKSLI